MYKEEIGCFEMSTHKIQTPGNHQKKVYNIQYKAKVLNQECLLILNLIKFIKIIIGVILFLETYVK
jgi:hypothetical protein